MNWFEKCDWTKHLINIHKHKYRNTNTCIVILVLIFSFHFVIIIFTFLSSLDSLVHLLRFGIIQINVQVVIGIIRNVFKTENNK